MVACRSSDHALICVTYDLRIVNFILKRLEEKEVEGEERKEKVDKEHQQHHT